MSATIFDSALYRDVFTTPAMRAVFGDEAQISAYVRAEVALALAQGETGVIPREAAQTIARDAPAVALDREQLKRDTENVGYPIVGLVRQLSEQLGDAGRYVHWGATTQDIMDTATVLQARDALALIEAQLVEVMAALARLARQHRDTPMAGRTHLQQALPITFGHKAAIWLSALQRFGGAVRAGQASRTSGSARRRGGDARFARRSRAGRARSLCARPSISTSRTSPGTSRATDWSNSSRRLRLICGMLGKIGYDVMILMTTEIGEVFEPFASHRGASSTMPQKRNPISSEILLANAKMWPAMPPR